MNEDFRKLENVQLNNALMIIGLHGWGNAGEVSTSTVKYFADKLGAKKFGEVPPERFHNYFIQRPIVSIHQGIIQSYLSPKNDVLYWRDKEGVADLIFLLGYEPHLNWSRYTKVILRLAEEMEVKRIYTIGGYLADLHYKSEPPITASTNNKELVAELKRVKVELTTYRGPTSVYSEILWQAKSKNLDVVSMWCAVPIHIGGLYPKAVYHLLQKITLLTGVNIDLIDIKKSVEFFEDQLAKETMTHQVIKDQRNRGREKEPTYRI